MLLFLFCIDIYLRCNQKKNEEKYKNKDEVNIHTLRNGVDEKEIIDKLIVGTDAANFWPSINEKKRSRRQHSNI